MGTYKLTQIRPEISIWPKNLCKFVFWLCVISNTHISQDFRLLDKQKWFYFNFEVYYCWCLSVTFCDSESDNVRLRKATKNTSGNTRKESLSRLMLQHLQAYCAYFLWLLKKNPTAKNVAFTNQTKIIHGPSSWKNNRMVIIPSSLEVRPISQKYKRFYMKISSKRL